MSAEPDLARRSELAVALAAVHERITAAALDAGRARDGVALVVVTKTWPASDVRLLAGLGVVDVGENRDQEAAPKAAACADLALRWHFIGGLQRNKARSVASYADVVESVDRPDLVAALARGAEAADRNLDVLVQVSLDGSGGRSGALPADVPALADLVAGTDRLTLAGVMAVAPLGEDPERAFERLSRVAEGLRRDHPQATTVSAGMSGDLEAAVRHGATHVRVGTAVLGGRPPLG